MRLERNLCLIATTGTGNGIHGARLTFAIPGPLPSICMAAACLLVRRTARGATARRVGEATALEKFLFASREGKFLIAVAAIQDPIGKFYHTFSISRLQAPRTLLYCAASNRHPTRSTNAPYSVCQYSTSRLSKVYFSL